MADGTSIEWTDATWNPVRGCSRLSPGCGGPRHEGGCYAEKIAARFSEPGMAFHGFAERTEHGGRWTGKMALVDDMLLQPLRWRRPRRIFVNSMSDLFHENLPDEAIDKVFAVMALCPQHTFQVLTKRADRMRDYWLGPSGNTSPTGFRCPRLNHILNVADRLSRQDHPRAFAQLAANVHAIADAGHFPNVWLGVSTEDQARADERIPHLLAAPAAVRWISAEPLLGALDLTKLPAISLGRRVRGLPPVVERDGQGPHVGPHLDWVVAGGESGPGARPCHPDWARSLRNQCARAGVPFFFKQWGEYGPEPAGRNGFDAFSVVTPGGEHLTGARAIAGHPEGAVIARVGKKRAGAKLDGVEHREFPR